MDVQVMQIFRENNRKEEKLSIWKDAADSALGYRRRGINHQVLWEICWPKGEAEGSHSPTPLSLFRSPQPPFQDSNGRITRIFLPTHCLRSCRRPCGAGNHQSYRWWQDGPSSRSRTSRSHGSDPDLCQSSDRPDLPEKGRQFQLPGTRAAVSGEPSGSTAWPLRVHCSLSAGTTDALKSPRLRQLARQGQYGGVGGTNAALLDKCRQAKHLEQGSDLAVCVVTTAILSLLSRADHQPGTRRGYRDRRREGKIKRQQILTFILSLISNIHSYSSVP